MGRAFGGSALLLLSLFMLVGFLRADLNAGTPATIAALFLSVVAPAVGGLALIASHFGTRQRLAGRRDALRRQTLDAEVLRLAAERDGRLTVVELVTELAVTPEEAKALLDGMHARELAELEITDAGLLVYAFHDVKQLAEKPRAKGLLDA